MRRRTRTTSAPAALALAGAGLLTALAPAQVLPPLEPEQQGYGRLLDRVLAYVGDKVILESSVLSEVQARVNAVELTGRRPTEEEILNWQREYVRARWRDEALAQGAKTMRGATADQVESITAQVIDDYRRREVERAGSVNKYTEELGVLGKTWGHVYEEQRTETLAQIAEQQAWSNKLRDRWALMVTPSKMREFYRRNIDQFVQPGSMDLEVISLRVEPLTQAGRDATLRRAAELAAAWRQGDVDAEALAAQFGGTATVLRQVRDTEADPTRRELKEFAGRAAEGEVSQPLQLSGRSVSIIRAARQEAARDSRFEDPRTQALILRELVLRERARVRERLIKKSQKLFPIKVSAPLIRPGRLSGRGK